MAGVGSLAITSNGMVRVVAMVPSLRQGQAALLRGVGVGVGVSAASAGDVAPVSAKPFAVRSQLAAQDVRSVRPVAGVQAATAAAVQPRQAEVVTVGEKPTPESGVERRAEEQARPVVSAEEELRRRRAEAIDEVLRQFERKQEDMGYASIGLDSQAKRGQVVALFGMFQPAGQRERSPLDLVG